MDATWMFKSVPRATSLTDLHPRRTHAKTSAVTWPSLFTKRQPSSPVRLTTSISSCLASTSPISRFVRSFRWSCVSQKRFLAPGGSMQFSTPQVLALDCMVIISALSERYQSIAWAAEFVHQPEHPDSGLRYTTFAMTDEAKRISEARRVITEVKRQGVVLCLWHNQLVLQKGAKLSKDVMDRLAEHEDIIRKLVLTSFQAERRNGRDEHKWILRLGDKPGTQRVSRPAYLACGASTWCQRMIDQALMFEGGGDRYRWMILEHEQVGTLIEDDRGRIVACLMKLPEGTELGGPKGSKAQVLSACLDCIGACAPKLDDLEK